MTKFERDEEIILDEVKDYIAKTYGQHYASDGKIQTIDIWETLGIAEDVCRGTAIKYLMRYGKKNGKNKADLLKAMHYVVLMIYYCKEFQAVSGSAATGPDGPTDSKKFYNQVSEIAKSLDRSTLYDDMPLTVIKDDHHQNLVDGASKIFSHVKHGDYGNKE